MTELEEQSEPNGNRATVALVDAKVAVVEAKLDGLIGLIQSEFKEFQRRLEATGMLAEKVNGLSDRQLISDGRIRDLERWKDAEMSGDERRKNYRSVHLPSLLLALAAVVVALAVPLLLNS